jgi:putative transcriptional regulator
MMMHFAAFLSLIGLIAVTSLRSYRYGPLVTPRSRSIHLACAGPSEVERCEFSGRGCVLLALQSEHDHFLHKAAVLICDHDEKRGSKGVILGRPSAFTLGETAPNMPPSLQPNTLFMGGKDGPDMALMFHKYDFGGASKPIGNGIYVGALKEAREALEARVEGVHPRDFKFIFNNVEWPPGALEKEITEGRWDVVRLPTDMVLQQKGSSAEAIWGKARLAAGATK